MAYVAVKGGQNAIRQAANFHRYQQIRGTSNPLGVDQIRDQLHLAVDRIMSEGSLYAPDLAALAFKQASGDTLEAAFMMRAYRTTQPRIGYSRPADTRKMRVIRRISAAFKDIPGGQLLGPTSDYTIRLLNFELTEETEASRSDALDALLAGLPVSPPLPETFPKVVDMLRAEGLVMERPAEDAPSEPPTDITRQALTFPADRSAALQAMSMGETGSLLALAYSNMRGYGVLHPTVGELRVGYLPVTMDHPYDDDAQVVGDVLVTECEIIFDMGSEKGRPLLSLGYGICFGHNETKAISMAVLDRSIQTERPTVPSEDPEFVLMHVDGIESVGFCNHFKLPHYVTFQSSLDRVRKAREDQ